jgi:murein DD-endopeptidase MepM/ murein hydrolase activator NlpD
MKTRGPRIWLLASLLACFGAGVFVDGWLRTHDAPKPVRTPADGSISAPLPSPAAVPQATVRKSARVPDAVATTGPANDVPHGRLRMPIDGLDVESLKGGFDEHRGARPHEAVDMLAPRNTPIHAVENGTIAKLFNSKAGGLTIYQYDPSGRLCYYYAHLERYADSLREGQSVLQGDVIGYVGTTGNAPANTPHLHFAVFELTGDKRWWQGTAIDPYRVFKEQS